MFLTLQKWIVVSAIILGMGAHWAILQSVAWTGMVINFSQHASFKEALKKTFDGNHLCTICKIVKAGRKSEQNQERQKLLLKLDPFVCGISAEALFPPAFESFRVADFHLYFWETASPPTPPPLRA